MENNTPASVGEIASTENNLNEVVDNKVEQPNNVVEKPIEEKVVETPKNDAPKSNSLLGAKIQDYSDYKPDSRFEAIYGTDAHKESVAKFDKLANKINLSKDQYREIMNYYNDMMEEAKVFDTRSELQKQKDDQQWNEEQIKALGENANIMISKVDNFLKDYPFFNKEQKDYVRDNMGDAMGISIMSSMIDAVNGVSNEIPADLNVGGLPNDYVLAAEYYSPNTTEQRREQILQDRINAGRHNPLPNINK